MCFSPFPVVASLASFNSPPEKKHYQSSAIPRSPKCNDEATESVQHLPRFLVKISRGPFCSVGGVELVDPDGYVDGVVGCFQV